MKALFITGALLAAPLVSAQQSAYGQCGGTGWTGATTCVSGYYCSYLNAYYSQCIPGTASTTAATATATGTVAATTAVTTATATDSGNPFLGYTIYAQPYYSSEVYSIAVPSLSAAGSTSLAAKATAVAEVPIFTWLDTAAKVPDMETYLADISSQGGNIIAPFVVYDLPDRDCSALASNGEYSIADNGADNYKAYIQAIRTILLKYSDVKVVLVIEPDSLANLVTNLSVTKCANAYDTYIELTIYAVEQLALPNVTMYLDGGHSGWLGWPANITPAAALYAQIYTSAGSPSQLRGLVTNVSNYNGWSLDSCPSYTSPNVNCDEKKYINAIQPLLTSNGWPDAHFIIDTGRNGVQPTSQTAQGDWCNVINTGFGVRPTTDTGDALADAFVWVKPGGESDGTSNTTSTRYDAHCGYSDALQPAPEAGTWFQAYFVQLLTNANPSF
ncbi:hypothetical protein RUND412_003293 [Rhizina undulata]